MAKAVRDYKAEERRRNELARQRGYTSRAQLRNRVAKGVAVGKIPAYQQAGFSSQKEYKAARAQSAKWSKRHSQQGVSRYQGNGKHKDPAYFRAYYDAFVDRDLIVGKRAALRKYLVDMEGHVDAERWDDPPY